jgi:hypothetical protein
MKGIGIIICESTSCMHNSSEYTNDPRGGYCKLDIVHVKPNYINDEEEQEFAQCTDFKWCGEEKETLSNKERQRLIDEMNNF